MKKRLSAILISISIIVGMLSLNITAADTQKIFISPASDTLGVFWDIVTCEHQEPKKIKNDGVLQIGWCYDGDIIKLVDEIDFGKGLVSLKVMITHFDPVPEAGKIIVKAGDVIIAELVPLLTTSWADPLEVTGVLKEPIKGKQVVTFEWVNNSAGLGDITFEVTPDLTAATNSATTTSTTAQLANPTATKGPTIFTAATHALSSSSKSPIATEKNTNKSKNNTGLIVGSIAVIIVLGGAIATLFIIKKKK